MSHPSSSVPRRIAWQNVITVLSAAVLISAEVFGAAFAGGWALASLFGLAGESCQLPFTSLGCDVGFQAVFFVIGVVVMGGFVRNGMKVEPFTTTR